MATASRDKTRFGPSCKRSLGSRDVSELLRSYLTAGVFLVVAVSLVAAVMGLGSLVRPVRPQPEKYINYESGVDPAGSMWGQTQVRYYVFALLFVMFDVEAVFIFPWATQARGLRLVRPRRDGHLHRHPRPRPGLRVEEGGPPLDLRLDVR